MSWRNCYATETLRAQINEMFPHRSKVSDGTIGDASHASRNSDHNPWITVKGQGIVTAVDITNDPKVLPQKSLVAALTANPDDRIKYIIADGKITVSGSNLQKWKVYSGPNAHRHHTHISMKSDAKSFDSKRKFNLSLLNPVKDEPVAKVLPEGEHLSERTVIKQVDIPAPAQQNVNVPVVEEKAKPYNDVGLKDTLVSDAKAVIPANVGLNIFDQLSATTGLPAPILKIITVLAVAAAVFSAVWLLYRLVSYLAWTWREHDRVKTINAINANPTMKNIIAQEPEPEPASS